MAQMIVVGDSVHWGQGLEKSHKFASIVATQLGMTWDLRAHSGAVIRREPDSPAAVHGEVPYPTPTVTHQCETCPDPDTVDLVLLNGGVNDVSVPTIINPLTDPNDLSQKIQYYCRCEMERLLLFACTRFSRAPIVVTSYFPIFSHKSGPKGVLRTLSAHFMGPPPFFITEAGVVDFDETVHLQLVVDKVIGLCVQFWRESTTALQAAVDAANDAMGTTRVIFVEVPYTEDNAMYAGHPLLFQLDRHLSPGDEVPQDRKTACRHVHHDPFSAWVCSIAPVGHPNIEGEQLYASSILAALAPIRQA